MRVWVLYIPFLTVVIILFTGRGNAIIALAVYKYGGLSDISPNSDCQHAPIILIITR